MPLAKSFNWPHGLDKKLGKAAAFYSVIILSVGFGICMDFLGINPMRFLFWSAVINGVLAPFLLVGILMVARDAVIMKKQPSSLLSQVVVGVTTLAMFAAAFGMFYGAWSGGS